MPGAWGLAPVMLTQNPACKDVWSSRHKKS